MLTVFLSVFVECRRARAISLSPLIVAAAAVVVDVEARFPASPMIIYRTSVVSYRSLAENRESYIIQMQLLLCVSVCVCLNVFFATIHIESSDQASSTLSSMCHLSGC